jgi:hypothetical protein
MKKIPVRSMPAFPLLLRRHRLRIRPQADLGLSCALLEQPDTFTHIIAAFASASASVNSDARLTPLAPFIFL